MIRLVLCELAVDPEQLNPTFVLLPNVPAVMVLFPDTTVSPVELIPQLPLQT